MTNTEISSFEDFVAYINYLGSFDISLYQDKIAIIKIQGRPEVDKEHKIPPSKLRALVLTIVEKGELTMNIDYRPCRMGENMMVVMSDRHFIQFVSFSDDLRCYTLFGVHDYVLNLINDIHSIMMPDVLASLMANPVVGLEKAEFAILRDNTERLRNVFHRSEHAFQSKLVHHQIAILTIEITNILQFKFAKEQHHTQKISNREHVVAQFLKLLLEHSATEREVSFYADKLCVTPVYLLRAAKHVLGKSAREIINEMAISDAMVLLRNPDMSIQDAADAMNFPDRAVFSKFFKKNTGVSPGKYQSLVEDFF